MHQHVQSSSILLYYLHASTVTVFYEHLLVRIILIILVIVYRSLLSYLYETFPKDLGKKWNASEGCKNHSEENEKSNSTRIFLNTRYKFSKRPNTRSLDIISHQFRF